MTQKSIVTLALLLSAACSSDAPKSEDGPIEGGLIINEMMADNSWTLPDDNGEFWPWIEVYNSGPVATQLHGWQLRSRDSASDRWSFPEFTLGPNQYLVVFLSGKDRADASSAIHAGIKPDNQNFSFELIDSSGAVTQNFPAAAARQYQEVSFGFLPADTLVQLEAYLDKPTPGESNSYGSPVYTIRSPEFSHSRGYHETPFSLTLRARGGSDIYFTVDGSIPSKDNGLHFEEALQIESTTILRAVATSDEFGSSRVETHTMLFLDDLVANKTMQRSIVNDPLYGPILRSSLVSFPALSIVTPEGVNRDTPLAASAELIDPAEQELGFQIDCGVKLVGGHSLGFSKQSMRLYFREEFGPSKLKYPLYANTQESTQPGTSEFDQLHLRSGSHDSIFYLGADAQPPANAQYIRNRWMQDTMFRMGHLSTRGRFVQVYLDGQYHGIYHLQERATRSHLASYLGGEKADYGYVNSAISDDLDIWAQVKASLPDWDNAQSWIDMDSLIDYQLLQYYAGNDWDWLTNKNWMAAGPRNPGSVGWKFFPWDSDISFISETANNTDPASLSRTNQLMNAPDSVFTDLLLHPEFLARVRERILLHFYGDGVLTPAKVIESYRTLADKIEPSLVAEAARWGNESAKNWRPDTDWQPEKIRLLESFFVNRTQIVLGQLQAQGIFSP